MDFLYEYMWGWKGIVICSVLALIILLWLRKDMKRQREWREAKEQKIARLERRIADKKKQAKQASLSKEE